MTNAPVPDPAGPPLDFGLHFSCSSLEGGDWPDLYDQAIEQTALGEELGFTYAVVAEHHFKEDGWIPSPTLLCAAIARATERVKVGTDIFVAPLHHPIEMAEDMVVLDNLSRGRAVCGIGLGAGENEFRAYGVPFRQRVSRTEEAMAALRQLMTGQPTTLEGKYFQFEDVQVTPRPVQSPRPEILYGAQSEPGARRAARLADRMVIAPHTSISLVPVIRDAYYAQLEEQGEARKPTILRREGFVAQTSAEAKRLGFQVLRDQYSRVYSHVSQDASDSAFAEYLSERFVVGDPDEVVEQLLPFIEAAECETVIFRLQMPGLSHEASKEAITLLAKEVLPGLRRRLGQTVSA